MDGNTENGTRDGTGGTAVPPAAGTAAVVPATGVPVPPAAAPVPTTASGGTGTDSRTGTDRRSPWYRRLGRRYHGNHAGTGTGGTGPSVPATVITGTEPAPGTGTDPATSGTSYRYQPASTEAALRAHLRDVPVPVVGTGRRNRKQAAGTDDTPKGFFAKLYAAIGAVFEVAPLAAPLIASGWFTYLVVSDEYGLDQPLPIAVTMVLGLEGVVWTLAKLYEKRLVAGHSTIADRLGIMAVVGAIGSLIYWHSMTEAKAKTAAAKAAAIAAGADPDTIPNATADWRGAAIAASMSAIGVFVYGRKARWNRRLELEAEGRVDMQALRIGFWQWVASPWESFWSFRHGMKYRIKRPTEAVRDWRLWKQAGKPKLWPPAMAAGSDGTGTDEMISVPAWMIAELLGDAASTGTTVGSLTRYPVPTSPGPTGTAGTAGTGTGRMLAAGTGGTGGTAAGTAATLAGTGEAGTGGTGTGGTAADSPTIAQYRTRNAARLDKIRKALDGTDGRPDWRTIAESELTLSLITSAGGFSNRADAGQCKNVLLADRAREAR